MSRPNNDSILQPPPPPSHSHHGPVLIEQDNGSSPEPQSIYGLFGGAK